jgi:hypothetical protein
MNHIDQAKRAPDLRALGLALVAGVIISKTERAGVWQSLFVVALGIGCYYVGTEWEAL